MALDPITGLEQFADTVVSKVLGDKTAEEQDQAKLLLLQTAQQFQLVQAQTDIDKVEASNESAFVSGARPFILWVCGFAFMYDAILEPLMDWVARVAFAYTAAFPQIDTTITMQVMFAMLGLGAFRSFDKSQTVAGKVSISTAKSLPPGAP
jgi:hypothetical protein